MSCVAVALFAQHAATGDNYQIQGIAFPISRLRRNNGKN
jgi:hypothetical protein